MKEKNIIGLIVALSAFLSLASRIAADEKVTGQSLGFLPLSEMGETKYKGVDGGLYGKGMNVPPAKHALLAEKQIAQIMPLDPDGEPRKDGKIVLISIGMSNTTFEFSFFKTMADRARQKAPEVLIVDTAQGSRTARAWAESLRAGARSRSSGSVWDEADGRIKEAGATIKQVQAVWIKLAGSNRETWPKHVDQYQLYLAKIVTLARARYPNLKVAYFSSRIYAGYATTDLSPEPWSYETGFGVRKVLLRQIGGDPLLDVEKGKAPILLWGPYLWGDGVKPRKTDGLVWRKSDFARDGTHPSRAGKEKVARALLQFFTTDPLAKSWFCRDSVLSGARSR